MINSWEKIVLTDAFIFDIVQQNIIHILSGLLSKVEEKIMLTDVSLIIITVYKVR